jgi:hypothetical protein
VRPYRWDARFLALGPVFPNQTVRVEFPIWEREVKAVMSRKDYTLVVRGDTVVAIEPEGVTGALYQRDHFRQGEPTWLEVTRFISDEILDY